MHTLIQQPEWEVNFRPAHLSWAYFRSQLRRFGGRINLHGRKTKFRMKLSQWADGAWVWPRFKDV